MESPDWRKHQCEFAFWRVRQILASMKTMRGQLVGGAGDEGLRSQYAELQVDLDKTFAEYHEALRGLQRALVSYCWD